MRQEHIVRFLRRESSTAKALTADLVVAASYSSLPDKLTDGTREGLKLALKFHDLNPRAMLAFCNCAHSKFPWKKIFPNARIIIRCFPHRYEYQPDHPFENEREFGRYVLMSVARWTVLRLFPIGWFRNLHH
ncbi:hypothetical protein HY972_02410 [Candidatus Kaiserbacteria bacterium]|nr:hypothetical protein [Candidatus Kaiserbacteria bacterium]